MAKIHTFRNYSLFWILITKSNNEFQNYWPEFLRFCWLIRTSFRSLGLCDSVIFCQKQSDWLKTSWKFGFCNFEIGYWIRWAKIYNTFWLLIPRFEIQTLRISKPSLKIETANTIFWNSLGLFRDYSLNHISFRNKTSLFFKIKSWNFQHLLEKKIRETDSISMDR